MVQPSEIFAQASRILTSYQGLSAFGLGHPDLGTSTVWPSANAGVSVRVFNARPWTPTHAFVMNGAVVAGSIDIALYEVGSHVRLGSIGATLQAGTNAPQFVAFTTPIPAGDVEMALSLTDAATATVFAQTDAIVRALAGAQMAAANPLPDPFVPADPTNFAAILPLFGFLERAY